MAQVVDPNIFANPSVIPDVEEPRVFDPNMRFDDHSTADLGAKPTQDAALYGREGEYRFEKNPFRQKPNPTLDRRSRLILGIAKMV
jgi:hypothetical protein